MGYNSSTVTDSGFEIVAHTKRIKGECPMCGKEFDIEFDLKDGVSDYGCPCGYFRFDADSENVTKDNHGIPQEEWKRRLAENLNLKKNEAK